MYNNALFTPPKSKYFLITSDILLPTLVLVLILVLLWLALFSPVFIVTTIDCYLDARPCPSSSITVEINKVKGANIFRYRPSLTKKILTSADFTVREVEIKKILPHTLRFELSSVYPVVALKLKDVSRWIIFDEQLRIIKDLTSDPNVPTVIIPGPLSLRIGASPTDPELRSVLMLSRTLSTIIPDLQSLTLDNHVLTLTFHKTNAIALLNPALDLDAQISSLRAILGNATINSGVKVIDVRFAQPVLKYN